MTALDHPDLILTDRRTAIMDAARDMVNDAAQRRLEDARATFAAALEPAGEIIAAFVETYGADPTAGMTATPCTDPDHAYGSIHTAAGFDFELVREDKYPSRGAIVLEDGVEIVVWLLHPETAERVTRVTHGTTWAHIASRLVAMSPDTIGPDATPPRRDHPAEILLDALAAFIDARAYHAEGF